MQPDFHLEFAYLSISKLPHTEEVGEAYLQEAQCLWTAAVQTVYTCWIQLQVFPVQLMCASPWEEQTDSKGNVTCLQAPGYAQLVHSAPASPYPVHHRGPRGRRGGCRCLAGLRVLTLF